MSIPKETFYHLAYEPQNERPSDHERKHGYGCELGRALAVRRLDRGRRAKRGRVAVELERFATGWNALAKKSHTPSDVAVGKRFVRPHVNLAGVYMGHAGATVSRLAGVRRLQASGLGASQEGLVSRGIAQKKWDVHARAAVLRHLVTGQT